MAHPLHSPSDFDPTHTIIYHIHDDSSIGGGVEGDMLHIDDNGNIHLRTFDSGSEENDIENEMLELVDLANPEGHTIKHSHFDCNPQPAPTPDQLNGWVQFLEKRLEESKAFCTRLEKLLPLYRTATKYVREAVGTRIN
jgi:hypothetical protein